MSFQAKLKVAGKEVNVLACNYALKQETDATGRPSSITRGGKVTLTVESTGETTFFEWMCNNFERKDGSIVFVKRDTNATLKELNFSEAYLVDYRENFDSTGDSPITETFTLSAKSIELGSGKHENEWVK
jgi:Hemolysin coregulated protein Hcp (TssD)